MPANSSFIGIGVEPETISSEFEKLYWDRKSAAFLSVEKVLTTRPGASSSIPQFRGVSMRACESYEYSSVYKSAPIKLEASSSSFARAFVTTPNRPRSCFVTPHHESIRSRNLSVSFLIMVFDTVANMVILYVKLRLRCKLGVNMNGTYGCGVVGMALTGFLAMRVYMLRSGCATACPRMRE